MRYKELPLEHRLEDIRSRVGEKEMVEERSRILEGLLRHEGFQIIVILLRDIEFSALGRLRDGKGDPADHARCIRTVDYIRKAIGGIVPQVEIDWAEEEIEEFMPPDIAEF